jgi:hypothetical protein
MINMRIGHLTQQEVLCWVPFSLNLVLRYTHWGSNDAKRISTAVLSLLDQVVTKISHR